MEATGSCDRDSRSYRSKCARSQPGRNRKTRRESHCGRYSKLRRRLCQRCCVTTWGDKMRSSPATEPLKQPMIQGYVIHVRSRISMRPTNCVDSRAGALYSIGSSYYSFLRNAIWWSDCHAHAAQCREAVKRGGSSVVVGYYEGLPAGS